MINFVLFTSVFAVFYAIDCMIEHFIFASTYGKYPRAIQTEQRKLLETFRILKEWETKLETVSIPTQRKDHQTTTSTTTTQTNGYYRDEIFHTVSYNTSLVVYNPPLETSFLPLVYLGSLVALVVLVVFISKRFKKTSRKQNNTSDECELDVFEDCVEHLDESSDDDSFEDCVEELFKESSVTEPDEFEEWFDVCTELNVAIETNAFEDCVDELLEKESIDVRDTGVFMFGMFSLEELEERQMLQGTKPSETIASMSNQTEEQQPSSEKKVEENKDENMEKESGIFKTDQQISQTTNKAPSYRPLQTWEPAKDEEVADLECLEKDDEDLKDQTILSPEEMYRLNPHVQSTFLEDLSQYSTELDVSSLSKEQIELAENMANEIMKESKQRKNKQRRQNVKRKRTLIMKN